jgi:hypothetical protein
VAGKAGVDAAAPCVWRAVLSDALGGRGWVGDIGVEAAEFGVADVGAGPELYESRRSFLRVGLPPRPPLPLSA